MVSGISFTLALTLRSSMIRSVIRLPAAIILAGSVGFWLAIPMLAAQTARAAPGDKVGVVRDLAVRVGPVVGSALACKDIARPRIRTIVEKFAVVIKEATANVAERAELSQLLDSSVADGRGAVKSGLVDCDQADRQLAALERSIAAPAADDVAPNSVATATATAAEPAAVATGKAGMTDREIRFGMSAPFSGPAKELGRQMKLGIDTAFNQLNDSGGIDGRMLRLIAADDGYEPSRTVETMNQLVEKEQVFGILGNVGDPTAVVAVPYALQRHMLFFGAFTGANVLRHDPPDRYVFNYRASYAEETDAVVHYLVKLRRVQPGNIAVFAQKDAYGDSGFAGVAKAIRALGANDRELVRLDYKRNTVDVEDAVNRLRSLKRPVKAIVMVATYRAAAKFIEKARNLFPGMIFANVSFVDGTALADELRLLGPQYASGVIVTEVTPAVGGYSSLVLQYKNALAKYFPGEAPDYVSLEGYISASILIQALKRVGPEFDTEKLIDALEGLHDLDLGLGGKLSFDRDDHQASHRIWGTVLDDNGHYQPIELE
jgi:ABC-type branched-subunit amino acid transport system substrate-binding protein